MRIVEVVFLYTTASTLLAHPREPFRTLYAFGDSYSDIGQGYLDGNGPTAVAYLAKELGLELIPPKAQKSAKQSLDFAVSGAQTGRGEGKQMGTALLGYGMQNQVEDFAKAVREHRIVFDPKRTLFFLAGGLNDRQLETKATVTNLETEIRALYGLGGRHFELALMPTLIPAFSEVGKRLNPALALIPETLKTELPDADVRLSHWGEFFDEVMKNPGQYGIDDTHNRCAGREIFGQDTQPCSSPDSHYYYHEHHPSTAVHKIVGMKMAAEVKNSAVGKK